MTTTTWTTTSDVPPPAWAALIADMRVILDVLAAGGTTLTAPNGDGPPLLDDQHIGFTATAPSRASLTVTFDRAAGTSDVTTTSAPTSALVLATLTRAARYWGTLLTWSSDADTTSRAMGDALVDNLFGANDRALTGDVDLATQYRVWRLTQDAHDRVSTRPDADRLDLPGFLGALIGELTAVRTGIATALQMLTPPAPAPAPPTEEIP